MQKDRCRSICWDGSRKERELPECLSFEECPACPEDSLEDCTRKPFISCCQYPDFAANTYDIKHPYFYSGTQTRGCTSDTKPCEDSYLRPFQRREEVVYGCQSRCRNIYSCDGNGGITSDGSVECPEGTVYDIFHPSHIISGSSLDSNACQPSTDACKWCDEGLNTCLFFLYDSSPFPFFNTQKTNLAHALPKKISLRARKNVRIKCLLFVEMMEKRILIFAMPIAIAQPKVTMASANKTLEMVSLLNFVIIFSYF